MTSFLSDISYDPLETWLLPKSEMLCMIRYRENPPKDAHEDGQAPNSTDEENQWKGTRTASRSRTSGQDPGHPAPGVSSSAASQSLNKYRPRTSGPSPEIRPEARTSGATHQNLQKLTPPARTSGLLARTSSPSGRPGHAAHRPDIRPRLCAHSKGPRPLYPFAP